MWSPSDHRRYRGIMRLSYRPIDYSSDQDCALLAKWYNDVETKHLYSCFPNAEAYEAQFTASYFRRFAAAPPNHPPFRNLFVLVDGEPVGEAKFETDPPKLVSESSQTAWLALMIAERRLWRCGLGRQIVEHLETLASDAGAQRVEVGIFEYNPRSLRFFERLGYQEFNRREGRFWWDGRMWADIRLIKPLKGSA